MTESTISKHPYDLFFVVFVFLLIGFFYLTKNNMLISTYITKIESIDSYKLFLVK